MKIEGILNLQAYVCNHVPELGHIHMDSALFCMWWHDQGCKPQAIPSQIDSEAGKLATCLHLTNGFAAATLQHDLMFQEDINRYSFSIRDSFEEGFFQGPRGRNSTKNGRASELIITRLRARENC